MTVRRQINNQTGRQHLSLADYLVVGTDLCDGAVNDDARLREFADELDLTTYVDVDTAAAALWRKDSPACSTADWLAPGAGEELS